MMPIAPMNKTSIAYLGNSPKNSRAVLQRGA